MIGIRSGHFSAFSWAALLLATALFSVEISAQELSPHEAILSRQPQKTERKANQRIFTGDPGEFYQDHPLSFEEQNEFMRKYCRVNTSDIRCKEFPYNKNREKREKQRKVCENDPLDKRCAEQKSEALMEAYRADRVCNEDPKSKKCKSARRKTLRK